VPYGRLTPRTAPPADVAPLLAADRFVLVVHPRSAGERARVAARRVGDADRALPAERFPRARQPARRPRERDGRLACERSPSHAHDLTGRLTLAELVAVLAAAGGVIAASTGPVHLAAAAGTRALGLFSPVRPVHPGRWAPLGPRAEVLVAPSACTACADPAAAARGDRCTCMTAITPATVRSRVEAWAAEPAAGGRGL
jgi:ADP-heptose:LPS heptosyltransferase